MEKIMQFINFIITSVIQSYTIILLLKIWIELVQINNYNPFSKIIFKITQIVINPINNIIPYNCNVNIIILLISYILTLLNILFIMLITKTLKLINVTLFIIVFFQLLTYIGKLIFWLISIRVMFNLFFKKENKINFTLIQLTDPIIFKINKIIPLIFGFDFSCIFILLILLALNYIKFNFLLYIEPNITNILHSVGYLM